MASRVTRILQSSFQCGSCLARRQLSATTYNRRPSTYCQFRYHANGLSTASTDWSDEHKTFTHESPNPDQQDTHNDFTDTGSDAYDHLYPEHIPTSLFQKALLSAGAATMAITNPWRGDMIATLGETTGHFALIGIRQKMLADPVGRQILEEQPRINTKTVDIDYLRQLPPETYGRVYADWLDHNRCSPDDRLPVHFVDDLDLAYVMQRYREIHDLIHALLGMPTHMLGEVVVKWVEGLQLGLPMCLSGALLGPLRLRPKQQQLFRSTHLPFAIRTGRYSNFLMNVYYEHEWETPVEELRAELRIEQPPQTPAKMWGKKEQ